MAAQRVVSLKGKKPDEPTEHFVRLSRGENGAGFVVGYVDYTGIEDFRSQSEYRTYDEALKEAQQRAYSVRRPLRDDTGVERVEPLSNPTVSKAQVGGTAVVKAPSVSFADLEKQLDEMPTLSDGFALPDVSDRLRAVDVKALLKRSALMHRCARAGYLEDHAKRYGDSRNYAVTYSQKTHDQIQGQIAELSDQAVVQQAILYGYLEAAFARIEELERRPKGLNYRGVYQQGESYEPQDCTTWGGSMWVAKEATTEKPGEADSPWVLACKKGRDGKDLSQCSMIYRRQQTPPADCRSKT